MSRAKNILVFCDGTGQDGLITDEAPVDKDANHFTNVLRLSRAITTTFEQGKKRWSQIVYYQSGVGVPTDFDATGKLREMDKQAFGTAVASKIRDAYNFITKNYEEGDQICIFGFSRGAYTARKVSGLIDRLGLLPPSEMGKFFIYWKQLNKVLPGDPPEPVNPVRIKCVGTWDTVGSVYDLLSPKLDALTLRDAKMPSNVDIALHAVAFHENRGRFMCTLYDGATEDQVLKQVWFPGAHSDVGGGYANSELADISLAWMVGEIKGFVGIDEDFALKSKSQNSKKPEWGRSKPVDAYTELGWYEKGLIGYKDRLSLLSADSILHPSLFNSPNVHNMITLSQLYEQLPGWDVSKHTWTLNDFELRMQKGWKQVSRDPGEGSMFESFGDLESMM